MGPSSMCIVLLCSLLVPLLTSNTNTLTRLFWNVCSSLCTGEYEPENSPQSAEIP